MKAAGNSGIEIHGGGTSLWCLITELLESIGN